MLIDYQKANVYQADDSVLNDVNFQVDADQFVYVIGKVGSGKSSLLKTIYCEVDFDKDDAEKAEVLGRNLLNIKRREIPALRREMGIIFQDFQLLHDRNVQANLDFVLCATGWSKKRERQERIEQVLEMVGLQEQAGKRTFELSGGEQQRVCIARALLNTPSIILADEPTGNLDSENGELTMALLDEVRRQYHAAVIVSTHNMLWPDYFPGSVYCCKDGQLTAQPTTENI